ncbi:MAG: dockerin type I domain-containing protein [Ruminococcus sp.]|nr:dockerin type I domain-containing protein [Ruminococcus sp.]
MKTSAKKLFSLTLVLVMLFAMSATGLTVNAEEKDLGEVWVIVKNETFSTADSAPWEGVLIDQKYQLKSDSTMLSVVEDVFKDNNVSYSLNQYSYLSEVNGLSEYAFNGSGGWMMTLNDWFTSESSSAYTVSNGRLSDGDVITVQYSCSWGSDIGSLWGDTNTQLKNITLDGAEFAWAEEFTPSKTEYTIVLNPDNESDKIGVIPEAFNKNYQVKTYLNQYTPDQPGTEIKALTKELSVKEGDVIYIGVGNENWASMNEKTSETVYKLTVKSHPAKGDVNNDGVLNIKDATLIQKYLAKSTQFSRLQALTADVNGDGTVNISDVTVIQKLIAKAS